MAASRWLTPPLLALLVWPVLASAASAPPTGDELFVHRVLPVLKTKCLACHGDDEAKIKGGLDLRTRA